MSLYDIIQNILDVSKNHNLVREVGEGDIYNYLNSSEHQYPCVFLTVSSINDDLNLRNVNCTLFYVDRLTSDESNKILVQSLGLSVLSDIVERIAGDVDTVEYTTFTEKFTDLCGGVYASLSIGYPLDGACSNDFEVRELEVTENGVYDVLGYDRIVVTTSPKFVVPNEMKFGHSELTYLPNNLDFSYVKDYSNMFENNVWLKTIPQIDTSKGDTFYRMFSGCSRLESIPYINTSNCTGDFQGMFQDCNNLITIPQLDTSTGANFSNMFRGCLGLTTIPQLDTSNGTNFQYMFYDCNNLTTIPQLDTSNGTQFNYMFHSCNNITSIPQLNTSNGTNFQYMFYDCKNLTTIPQLDTSNGTQFNYMFQDCKNLVSVELINTSKGTYFGNMFYNCSKVESIKTIDLSKVTYSSGHSSMFHYCYNLKNVEFEGSINYTISFATNELLTYESVKSILTACSNTTKPTTSKAIYFTRTLTDQNSELVNLIATCTSKGWTISGLTIN